MNASAKKFFLLLVVAIVGTVIILIYQIIKTNKISVNHADKDLIETNAVDIPIDPLDPIIGNRGASITITEFIDYTSADSRDVHKKLVAAVEKNPTKLRLLVKDFPATGLFAGDHARPNLAAYCAEKQSMDKFLAFVPELISANKKTFTDDDLKTIANKIGLNETAWSACLNSTEAGARIDSSVSLAKTLGLKNAPQIYINNRLVNYLDEIDLDDFLAELVKEY
ncbi:MAG: thioredoxin domain-containing protein [Patescibacteria group bacterium]